MSLNDKQVFTRKTASGTLYKWSPQTSITDSKPRISLGTNFCNAQAYSVDGQDGITKYVTKREVVNGIVRYGAYVACNYVQ